MEENFTTPDFEEFLQEQVRNHRMYPTDAVWRDINKKLHGDKKWPALNIAALVLLSATVLICLYFAPKPNIFIAKSAVDKGNNYLLPNSQNLLNSVTSSRFAKHKGEVSAAPTQPDLAKPDASVTTVANANGNPEKNSHSVDANTHAVAFSTSNTTTPEINSELLHEAQAAVHLPVLTTDDETIVNHSLNASSDQAKDKTLPQIKQNQQVIKDYNDRNMVDNFLKEHKEDVALHTQSKKKSNRNKFSFQIYAAPSISYRKLLEDPAIVKGDNTAGPVGLNYVTDVNNVVRHKPGTGFETGISFMYNLSGSFRIKTGFQFNMRQYSIEAYRSNSELATIALIGTNGIDTVNTLATYRTSNGYHSSSDELVNRYFQLAVPIGVEWQILGNKRIQFNVAASIQPTYLLNRNAYLLSTNFKNYTESPDIVKRWNINSNLETFVSFKVGDYKWQLGPQVRYQPYSTFIPQYPIKEHLLDYGMKLGVSKTFN